MMQLLIKNINRLVQTRPADQSMVRGHEMKDLPEVENAYLLIEEGLIKAFGAMDECPETAGKVMNAQGKMVFPCWCDSHTHLVYATSREEEFVDRIHGLSYEEIAKNGGGILNSAKKMQDIPEEDLLESAYLRLGEIKDFGTGAIEIKSGYGLSYEAELKMLRVIKKLKSISPLTIKSTFLGAHAIPADYKDKREEYISLVTDKMLPDIADEGLADYCDVFCDSGFFTPEETDRILKAADKFGLQAKIHGNELSNSGGVQVALDNCALSIDHLEAIGETEIKLLAESKDIMPCIMPTVAFFLGMDYAPARRLIDAGVPISLASDYNPGSSPSGKMSLVVAMACIQLKLTPEEAINAATLNGAFGMGVEKELGSIAVGKRANVFVTRRIPSLAYIPYAFGSDHIETVIIGGEIQ